MATPKQKTKVGIFLCVSAALMAWAIVTLAGFRQGDKTPYWLEFEESVLGLSVGNVVEYLGVPVGTVEDISILPNNHARVDISIRDDKVTLREGVRSQLVIYSIATGTMYVSLAGGDPKAQPIPAYSQIPTEPSLVESFRLQTETLLTNITTIAERVSDSLEGVSSGQLTSIMNDAQILIQDGQGFVSEATGTVQGLRENVDGAITDFRQLTKTLNETSGTLNELLASTKGKMDPLDLQKTQDELNRVLTNVGDLTEKMQTTVDVLDHTSSAILYDTDNVQRDLREGLKSMTETLEAVRTLADYLEQDPSSLVRGKGQPRGNE